MRSLNQLVLDITPPVVHDSLRTTRNWVVRAATIGSTCLCPVCGGRFRRFVSGGVIRRREAACPACRCLERHRLVWLYFRDRTDLFDGRPKKMLHIAPEACFVPRLQRVENLDYLTGDLRPGRAMARVDITAMAFPDATFDVVYCSHVLEHVEDDRAAMREVRRVLRPGGWAVLLVPIEGDETYEDPTIRTPEERFRAFRQDDHVRLYGRDVKRRLEETGFDVRADAYASTLGPEESRRMGLTEEDIVHFCRKPVP